MHKRQLMLLIFLFLSNAIFSQNTIETIDATVKQYAEKDLFSGVVLVTENGKPVYETAFGMLDREQNIPMKTDTKLKIGSIVKDFTAVLILQLAEQNKLDLDDPMGKYLDMFPAEISQKVTIRQLLRHEAGFGDYLRDPLPRETMDSLTTVARIIDLFKNEPLLFEPGTDEQYSNSGYTVLGAIIEKVTGKSYFDAVEQHILQPLGMSETLFHWRKIAAQSTRPKWYMRSATGRIFPAEVDEWPSPSGGAYATVGDLFKFEHSLLRDNRLLSDRSKGIKAARFSAEPAEWQNLLNDPKYISGKAGGSPGNNSLVLSQPAKGYTVIVLANMDEPIAEVVGKQIFTILSGGEPEPVRLTVFEKMYQTWKAHGSDYLRQNFESILANYELMDPPDFVLNRVGYDLLFEGNVDAAIDIFTVNTQLFPQIANTWDSLGEAHMVKGNRKLAIENYRKSLALNPGNQNAAEMLQKLETED
ncbi:MAG: serine hydrolase [Calditrichia bacterium]